MISDIEKQTVDEMVKAAFFLGYKLGYRSAGDGWPDTPEQEWAASSAVAALRKWEQKHG